MELNYEKLGNLIEVTNKKNTDSSIEHLVGMNINKEFILSVANTIGTDLSKYRVINQYQFAYNPMQVGRDKTIRVSMYPNTNPAIISPAYKIFKVNENVIIPEFLMMYFRRSEFDRLCWFHTDSSVRGSMDWPKFCDIDIPIPSLFNQNKIIKLYNFFNNRINIKMKINQNLILIFIYSLISLIIFII
jgi:type I restriction enzyme S subunit